MKKILLFAAVAALAANAMEARTNYVVNGEFENVEGIQRTEPWDWSLDTHMATNIPGWQDPSQNPWNAFFDVLDQEADYEEVFEGNKYFLHAICHNGNGWTESTISQVVKGLTPGTKYRIGCVYQYGEQTNMWWGDGSGNFYAGFRLEPCDEDGNKLVEDQWVKCGADTKFPAVDAWTEWHTDFTATASACVLSVVINNNQYDGNGGDGNTYFDVDDLVIMTPDEYQDYRDKREDESGVESVLLDENAEVTGVYNLQGVKVADTTEGLKGIYILRTTNGAKKVAL